MKKFLLTISTISLLAPTLLFAQSDLGQTLVNLPGLGGDDTTFESYINTIYALTITIAAMLAVIKIVIAGVKYMTTDIVTTKGDAKKDIYGAIIGLLVVLAAVLIIEVINPDINDVTMAIETQVAPEVDTLVNRVVTPVEEACEEIGGEQCTFYNCLSTYFNGVIENTDALNAYAANAKCAAMCYLRGGVTTNLGQGNNVNICVTSVDVEEQRRAETETRVLNAGSGSSYFIPCDGSNCTQADCIDATPAHTSRILDRVALDSMGVPTGDLNSTLECTIP